MECISFMSHAVQKLEVNDEFGVFSSFITSLKFWDVVLLILNDAVKQSNNYYKSSIIH